MRPELTTNEKRFAYSKYFDYPMTPIPAEKQAIIDGEPLAEEQMIKITERGRLFEPGHLDAEIGYGVFEEGTGYVANNTFMPGVTTEMLEWWFAWHSLEDARYKIWNPEGHYHARTQDVKKAMSHNMPMRERTWGTSRDVKADMGNGPEDLVVEFKMPSEMGYDESQIGTDVCSTLMCANIHGPEAGVGMPMVMTLMAREVEGGLEVRTRIWMGYQLLWGMTMKQIVKGESVPMESVKGLFYQNVKKYNHLATILPLIYEEEKDNF